MFTDSKTLLAACLIALTPAVCPAADGDLDPTFGDGGKVTTSMGLASAEDGANDIIASQADGKIVIVGRSSDARRQSIALARYHPDHGNLDTTFGTDGTVVTDLGAYAEAKAVAIQSDDKIVVAGWIRPQGSFILVLRYLSDGSLDPTFGSGGLVQIDIGSTSNRASDVALQPDGKIVVVGATAAGSTGDDFALVRLCSNGDLDTSFGVGGAVTTDFSTRSDNAQAIAIQGDGMIVVAGETYSGTPTGADFAVARYDTDGSLDPSFGTGGLVITDFGSAGVHDDARDLAIQSDGKIVVAGITRKYASISTKKYVLARYNSDGSLDTSFGYWSNGLHFGSLNSPVSSVTIQPDGKIIWAGGTSNVAPDFAMERLNPDGTRDLDFGNYGQVVTNFEPGSHPYFGSRAEGVEILSDGRIILGGSVRLGTFSHTGLDFALACYDSYGSLDVDFGADGLVITDFLQETHDQAHDAVAVQPDGKIVVVGIAMGGAGWDIAMVRYAADGSLDPTFGDGGVITTDINLIDLPYAVAIQPDSKIVVVGCSKSDEMVVGRQDFLLVRYDPDGSLDGAFGVGGIVMTDFGTNADDYAFAVVIQSDGKLVVAGASGGPWGEFVLARYDPDGTLDEAFGSDGLVTTGFDSTGRYPQNATDLAIQADGKYVVTGRGTDPNVGRVKCLARYNTDGSLDTSFGSGGLVTTAYDSSDGSRVVILDDGKILDIRAGVIARYEADGDLDTSFGSVGAVVTGLGWAAPRPGAALQPDGKILVAGQRHHPDTQYDFGLARFDPDGSLDTDFGTNGYVTTDIDFGYDVVTALALHGDTGVVLGGFAEIGDPPEWDFALVRFQLDLVTNLPPTAVAGPDQELHAGQTVDLDGSESYDDNTASVDLGFAWSFIERPTGSGASLTGTDTATPFFDADRPGTYRVQLIVTDDEGLSSPPDEVVISSENVVPTADAGDDASGVVGLTTVLDGSASFDPDGDPLAFFWAFQQVPPGSDVSFENDGAEMPSFVPDLPGVYVVRLVVDDSFESSLPDTVRITVITGTECAEGKLAEALDYVAGLPPESVTTKGNQRALTNFLSQAIARVQAGDIEGALGKVHKSMDRTDGCMGGEGPDGNGPGRDWITNFADQAVVYVLLMQAEECLLSMLS